MAWKKPEAFPPEVFDVLHAVAISGRSIVLDNEDESRARSLRSSIFAFWTALRRSAHPDAPLTYQVSVRVDGTRVVMEPKQGSRMQRVFAAALEQAGISKADTPSNALLEAARRVAAVEAAPVQTEEDAVLARRLLDYGLTQKE